MRTVFRKIKEALTPPAVKTVRCSQVDRCPKKCKQHGVDHMANQLCKYGCYHNSKARCV